MRGDTKVIYVMQFADGPGGGDIRTTGVPADLVAYHPIEGDPVLYKRQDDWQDGGYVANLPVKMARYGVVPSEVRPNRTLGHKDMAFVAEVE